MSFYISSKHLLVISAIFMLVLIAMSQAEESTPNKNRIQKRGITEWRFKRLNEKSINYPEMYDLVLEVKPKMNEFNNAQVRPIRYKIKFAPETEDDEPLNLGNFF